VIALATLLAAVAPHIAPAHGWTLLGRGPSQRDIPARMVVAVTTPDAASQRPFAMFTSLTRLRPSGILIWAWVFPRSSTHPFPRASWPLRLSSFRLDHGWEGQPAPNVQQRLYWADVGGWTLDVRVYFATQHPSRALVAKAQTELDRISLR
jgi:hypothetical protein